MLFDTTEHVLIAVHGRGTAERRGMGRVYAGGGQSPAQLHEDSRGDRRGGPNAKQRASINDYVSKTALTVAICTDALLVRQIGTALSWFNPRVTAFRGSDVVARRCAIWRSPGLRPPLVQHKVTKMRLEIEGRPFRAPR